MQKTTRNNNNNEYLRKKYTPTHIHLKTKQMKMLYLMIMKI